MYLKKKCISYILWIAAMVTFAIMAVMYAFLLGDTFLFTNKSPIYNLVSSLGAFNEYLGYGLALVCVLAALIVFVLGRLISKLFVLKIHIGEGIKSVLQVLLTVVVFAGAIAIRLLLYSSCNELTETSGYESALNIVQENITHFSESVHGASFVYVYVLSFVMRFLGANTFSVLFLQTVIQFVSIILAFFVGKKMFGYTAAIVATAVMAFSPNYLEQIKSADAGCFLGLLLLVGFTFALLPRNIGGKGKYLIAAISGIVIGTLIYLDFHLIVCVIPGIFAAIYEYEHYKASEEETDSRKKIKGLVALYIGIILTALFFIVCLIIDGGFSVNGFVKASSIWFTVSTQNLTYIFYAPLEFVNGYIDIIFSYALTLVAMFSVFGFVGKTKTRCLPGWILMIGIALSPLSKIGYLQDFNIPFVLFSFVVGLGIAGMEYEPKLEVVEETVAEEVEETEDGEVEKTVDGEVEEIKDEETEAEETEEIKGTDSAENKIIDEEDTIDIEETTVDELVIVEQAENKKQNECVQVDDLPGMIPNPLPLPKKRPHVALEFGYEVSDDKMCFDLDIEDDDDFDV